MIFELDYIYEYELESHAFKESSAQWFEDNSNIKKYRAAVNPYATAVKKQLLINPDQFHIYGFNTNSSSQFLGLLNLTLKVS